MKKLILLLVFMSVSSCSSNPSIKDMIVRMGDTDNIAVQEIRSTVRNGLLTAQVSITNDSNSSLIAYRFNFNKNGMKIFDDEAWKPITLSKGQSTKLVGIAPTPDATDFKIELNKYK